MSTCWPLFWSPCWDSQCCDSWIMRRNGNLSWRGWRLSQIRWVSAHMLNVIFISPGVYAWNLTPSILSFFNWEAIARCKTLQDIQPHIWSMHTYGYSPTLHAHQQFKSKNSSVHTHLHLRRHDLFISHIQCFNFRRWSWLKAQNRCIKISECLPDLCHSFMLCSLKQQEKVAFWSKSLWKLTTYFGSTFQFFASLFSILVL